MQLRRPHQVHMEHWRVAARGGCVFRSQTLRGGNRRKNRLASTLVSLASAGPRRLKRVRPESPVSHLGAPARLRPLTPPADGGRRQRVHGDSVAASERRAAATAAFKASAPPDQSDCITARVRSGRFGGGAYLHRRCRGSNLYVVV